MEARDRKKDLKLDINSVSLYIHFPFCRHKCRYCNFEVSGSIQESLIKKYLDTLLEEGKRYSDNIKNIKTVYIGGGTPSCMGEKGAAEFISKLKLIFDIKDKIEFNFEMNPEDVNCNLVKTLSSCGVNRISLGVESFTDKTLNLLGRRCTAKDNLMALEILKKNFTGNINADLITSIPGQKKEEIIFDIKKLKEFDLDHISLYTLEIEKNSDIQSLIEHKYLQKVKNEEYESLWSYAHREILNMGYKNYEVSNYAKSSSCFSKHNMVYWNNFNYYLGLGSGASSFLKDTHGEFRKKNYNLFSYISFVNRNLEECEVERIDNITWLKDRLLSSLRTIFGINLEEVKRLKKIDILELKTIKRMIGQELFCKNSLEKGFLVLKDNYRFVLDNFLVNIFQEIDNDKKNRLFVS